MDNTIEFESPAELEDHSLASKALDKVFEALNKNPEGNALTGIIEKNMPTPMLIKMAASAIEKDCESASYAVTRAHSQLIRFYTKAVKLQSENSQLMKAGRFNPEQKEAIDSQVDYLNIICCKAVDKMVEKGMHQSVLMTLYSASEIAEQRPDPLDVLNFTMNAYVVKGLESIAGVCSKHSTLRQTYNKIVNKLVEIDKLISPKNEHKPTTEMNFSV